MTSSFSRRRLLINTLLGAGGVGLRALATGLPVSFLLNPRQALADGLPACGTASKAQFFVFQTSQSGDPLNANVPGCYSDSNITHSADPDMAATALKLGAVNTVAAKPWSTLPQAWLDRTSFWHVMTNTPVHPKEPDVLRLMGAIRPSDMFPSMLARHLASCLGTVQAQPISVGANSPGEGLTYQGAALPIIPPLALKATLVSPTGALGNLVSLRDATLGQMNELLKAGATGAQRRYLDELVVSQSEVRNINQSLLSMLDSITDNSVASQITSALALIQMKVTPVVAIHIPFGGDNHNDKDLTNETTQTITGVASFGALLAGIDAAGLTDKVSVLSLNVFGRTLGPANTDGRQHNGNHQVSLAIGKPFKAGIVGGVAPVAGDFGATAIESATGASKSGGDVPAIDTLASFGKTVMSAVGIDSNAIAAAIPSGKTITGALT